MTMDELLEQRGWTEEFQSRIQSAILAEREECAKMVEGFGGSTGVWEHEITGEVDTCLSMQYLADAIRARSQPAPQIENKPAEPQRISFAGIQPG